MVELMLANMVEICHKDSNQNKVMIVRIKRVDKKLPLPEYQTNGSVGCDLYARVTTKIPSKSLAKIPANIIVETPPGFMFVVASRSSTPFKKGLMKANGIGIVDQDFSGPKDEINMSFFNFTENEIVVERGERIAQGIFVSVGIADWLEVKSMGHNKSRGGFGSTGGHK